MHEHREPLKDVTLGFNCAQPACALENIHIVGKRVAEYTDRESIFFFFNLSKRKVFWYIKGFLFTQKSGLSQQKIHFHISAVDLRL